MKQKNNYHTFVVLAYKESRYLEECILSVKKQSIKSDIVIATSTPNTYIHDLAKKYTLDVFINDGEKKSIGSDFDFALSLGKSELVTIAHQDDVYDYEYTKSICNLYTRYPKSLILFSDYYELRNNKKVTTNANLKIKRFLLIPSRMHKLSGLYLLKRSSIAFGNAICCPAVTFAKPNIASGQVFDSDFLCNVDWLAWERLSNKKGNFIYVPKQLMGHRVHEESTTTDIITGNIRTQEDYIMFQKFWPKFFAKKMSNFYKKSEESNQLK